MRTFKPLLLSIIAVGVLAACGLKGSLYLPDRTTSSQPAPDQHDDSDKQDTKKDKHSGDSG